MTALRLPSPLAGNGLYTVFSGNCLRNVIALVNVERRSPSPARGEGRETYAPFLSSRNRCRDQWGYGVVVRLDVTQTPIGFVSSTLDWGCRRAVSLSVQLASGARKPADFTIVWITQGVHAPRSPHFFAASRLVALRMKPPCGLSFGLKLPKPPLASFRRE